MRETQFSNLTRDAAFPYSFFSQQHCKEDIAVDIIKIENFINLMAIKGRLDANSIMIVPLIIIIDFLHVEGWLFLLCKNLICFFL